MNWYFKIFDDFNCKNNQDVMIPILSSAPVQSSSVIKRRKTRNTNLKCKEVRYALPHTQKQNKTTTAAKQADKQNNQTDKSQKHEKDKSKWNRNG